MNQPCLFYTTHARTHAHAHTRTHAHAHMHMHTHAHTRTCTHMHTHMHTHTHMQVWLTSCSCSTNLFSSSLPSFKLSTSKSRSALSQCTIHCAHTCKCFFFFFFSLRHCVENLEAMLATKECIMHFNRLNMVYLLILKIHLKSPLLSRTHFTWLE